MKREQFIKIIKDIEDEYYSSGASFIVQNWENNSRIMRVAKQYGLESDTVLRVLDYGYHDPLFIHEKGISFDNSTIMWEEILLFGKPWDFKADSYATAVDKEWSADCTELQQDAYGEWDFPDTREDVFLRLIRGGTLSEEEAVLIADDLRKGKELLPDQEEQLVRAGMTPFFINYCKKTKYLPAKAHCAERAHMLCIAAWQELHNIKV